MEFVLEYWTNKNMNIPEAVAAAAAALAAFLAFFLERPGELLSGSGNLPWIVIIVVLMLTTGIYIAHSDNFPPPSFEIQFSPTNKAFSPFFYVIFLRFSFTFIFPP